MDHGHGLRRDIAVQAVTCLEIYYDGTVARASPRRVGFAEPSLCRSLAPCCCFCVLSPSERNTVGSSSEKEKADGPWRNGCGVFVERVMIEDLDPSCSSPQDNFCLRLCLDHEQTG